MRGVYPVNYHLILNYLISVKEFRFLLRREGVGELGFLHTHAKLDGQFGMMML